MTTFTDLVIGNKINLIEDSKLQQVYKTIERKVDTYYRLLMEATTKNDIKFIFETPILCRSLMETATIALLCRLEPFRIITLKQIQESVDYKFESPSAFAIQWSGDILPINCKEGNMWKVEKFSNVDRSLLGCYYRDLCWIDAFERLLDIINEKNDLELSTLFEQYTKDEPIRIFESMRSKLMRSYSFFSKGIHNELLIEVQDSYTREDVKKNIVETLNCLTILSCMSHLTDFFHSRTDTTTIIELTKQTLKEVRDYDR